MTSELDATGELSDLIEWERITQETHFDITLPGTWPDARNWALFGYETIRFGTVYTMATPQAAHRLVTYLNRPGLGHEIRSSLLTFQMRRDALTKPNPCVVGGETHPIWRDLRMPAAHPKYVTLEKYLRENGLDPNAEHVDS